MKIGKSIKEIRTSKNLSKEFVASELKISTNQYEAIENDLGEITLGQLEILGTIFSCSPIFILQFKETSGSIYNHFQNSEGNKGININVQGLDQKEIRTAFKELYREELKRIPKLEKLLRENNIEFNF